ncbi:MAG: (d)CMP kinase [Proteobacteria bacterium]|nr:(d)CMP kinase [Pseudomonadota bacterium]
MIIAIDGPSGAGKSSVSREVANRLGWSLLDTGAIYRCVALIALEKHVDNDPNACAEIAKSLDIRFVASKAGQKVFIGDRDVTKDIRTFETTQCVNHVSPMPEVRAQLLDIQRRLGHATDSIVEGRDIGSVVFPDAELKVFYTASPQARAMRRMKEFQAKGEHFDFEEVVKQIKLRDETEFNREHSPLVKCEDAIVLDTSDLDFEESCQALIRLIQNRQKELA